MTRCHPECHEGSYYYLLPTAYYLLPTAYCLLPTAYCPLPTASHTLRNIRRWRKPTRFDHVESGLKPETETGFKPVFTFCPSVYGFPSQAGSHHSLRLNKTLKNEFEIWNLKFEIDGFFISLFGLIDKIPQHRRLNY